jgi:hypothetical protein
VSYECEYLASYELIFEHSIDQFEKEDLMIIAAVKVAVSHLTLCLIGWQSDYRPLEIVADNELRLGIPRGIAPPL